MTERTAHEKANELRVELLNFCSDRQTLEAFYTHVVATLPPMMYELDDNEGESSEPESPSTPYYSVDVMRT